MTITLAVEVRQTYAQHMSDQPSGVSAEDLHAVTRQAGAWEDAVRRAQRGEIVPVYERGEHVADVVPADEIESYQETIEVLMDPDAMRDLEDDEIAVSGIEEIRALLAERLARENG